MSALLEVNFDGLPGPTHNYAGLSHGNIASERNAARVSRPRAAALQGLAKMRSLAGRGVAQAFLPPQLRPDFGFLRAVGFEGGEDGDVLRSAALQAPRVLAAACSSSFMWTANAATVVPSSDSDDGRLHLVPANLISQPHRAAEAHATFRVLAGIFADETRFAVHSPLPSSVTWADEGAANHTRFHGADPARGVHLFVYGCEAGRPDLPRPVRFPARQTREASEAVARLGRLPRASVVFAQQHPAAVDAGVFHNDVIATGDGCLHLVHERAFLDQRAVRGELCSVFRDRTGSELDWIEVPEDEVTLEEAVRTYLFNSQIVGLPDGSRLLLAPTECSASPSVSALVRRLVDSRAGGIASVAYLPLNESMANGGGPACLRLRVCMTEDERAAVHPGVWLTPSRIAELEAWIRRWYREELAPADLCDPALAQECRAALAELSALTGIEQLPA